MVRITEGHSKKLFPEIVSVLVTPNHIRMLDVCLQHPTGILQSALGKELDLKKKTISLLKSDLIRLGWLRESWEINKKVITIRTYHLREIREFLRQWQFLQQSVLVRPHSILARGIIRDRQGNFKKAIDNLSEKYQIWPYHMKNNIKYVISLPGGTAIMHNPLPGAANGMRKKNELIQFYLPGFIVPVTKKDLESFGDYVRFTIQSRLEGMVQILREHFSTFKVEINNVVHITDMHCGILMKKDVASIVRTCEMLREYGLVSDKSISGFDEYEEKGNIEFVLDRISGALHDVFM